MRATLLVVDDDADLLQLIAMRLAAAGHEVVTAASGEEALAVFHLRRPQVVITDLRMGEMDGMALFAHLQEAAPLVPVIVLTAHGTIPEAVAATQKGVFSFLTKPFDGQELLRRVADALRISPVLDSDPEEAAWRQEVLGGSLCMQELLREAYRVAREKRTSLIQGAPGTGKRSLARAMYRASCGVDAPFVEFCASDFTAEEAEQLFGQTGYGPLFQQAQGGVLYLRDVICLTSRAQSRLFSFLFAQMQARNPLQRLAGSTAMHLPDVLVIVGSDRSLDAAVADGSLRSDLYHLLLGGALLLPSLCERGDDITLLARHFLSRAEGRSIIAPEALQALKEARWPGNVRQLQQVIDKAAVLSHGGVISESAIRRIIRDTDEATMPAFDDARRDFERDYLVTLLKGTAGNVTQAARIAQRNRTEFYKLLGRHGLDPAAFKEKGR